MPKTMQDVRKPNHPFGPEVYPVRFKKRIDPINVFLCILMLCAIASSWLALEAMKYQLSK